MYGLDVHQATIVVAVMDPMGKLVMESILETEPTGPFTDTNAGYRPASLGLLGLGARGLMLWRREEDASKLIEGALPAYV